MNSRTHRRAPDMLFRLFSSSEAWSARSMTVCTGKTALRTTTDYAQAEAPGGTASGSGAGACRAAPCCGELDAVSHMKAQAACSSRRDPFVSLSRVLTLCGRSSESKARLLSRRGPGASSASASFARLWRPSCCPLGDAGRFCKRAAAEEMARPDSAVKSTTSGAILVILYVQSQVW